MIYHLKQLDWVLMASVLLLGFTGLMSIASTQHEEVNILFEKQIIFFSLGILAIIFLSVWDYRFFNHPKILISLYFFSLFLLVSVFVFGREVRGSTSWFELGPIRFEPVEGVKFALIFFLARYFALRHKEVGRPLHIGISGIYTLFPALLVLLQPDVGSALILVAIWFWIMLVAGIKPSHLVVFGLVAVLVFSLGWSLFFKDYQKDRILSFLNPQYDPRGAGYHVNQSIIAIGSGGLLGSGLRHGTQSQLGFLPEPATDFVFAAIGEEFGILGASIVLVLFMLIVWQIITIGRFARNNFARFLCIGIAALLGTQIFVNIGMNIGIFPITGVPLPFVSYGGSSLLATSAMLGIAQSVKAHS